MKQQIHIHITAEHDLLDLKLGEVWEYRNLVWLYARRTIIAMYKQIILDPLWLIINPLLTFLEEAGCMDKDTISFVDGEPMRMRLRWRNLKDYEHLCARVEVYTIEDVLQASEALYSIASGKTGDTGGITFERTSDRNELWGVRNWGYLRLNGLRLIEE